MNYTLLIFSIINPKNLSFRYFISDKDWYKELHMEIEYNMYSKTEMEDTIIDRELKEISFEEIKDYTFTNTMNIAVYDGFTIYNEDNLMHYTLDEDDDDYDTLLYGRMERYDFKVHKQFKVNDIVKPIIKKFNGKYDSSAKDIYLVPVGESLDEEYALEYNVFSNETDADLFLSLYEKGEVAPYIFMNSDYHMAVQNHSIFKDVKCIMPNELSNLLKTKNIILKQSIFTGSDIYN